MKLKPRLTTRVILVLSSFGVLCVGATGFILFNAVEHRLVEHALNLVDTFADSKSKTLLWDVNALKKSVVALASSQTLIDRVESLESPDSSNAGCGPSPIADRPVPGTAKPWKKWPSNDSN